ncbi:MAG: type II toxin-antitoxin system VapC family toxin [Longimicrobiales bacterium]
MITAVDTNVLLDVLVADRTHGPRSRVALKACMAEGGLVACPVVWCEVATFFPDADAGRDALERMGLRYEALEVSEAMEAARRWSAFRAGKAEGPRRIAADFLIGAHALNRADRLLTRDRGFFAAAFAGLAVLDPSV